MKGQTRPWRWTKYRKAIRALLTQHNYTVDQVFHRQLEAYRKADWWKTARRSEQAATLADCRLEIEEVARRCIEERRDA